MHIIIIIIIITTNCIHRQLHGKGRGHVVCATRRINDVVHVVDNTTKTSPTMTDCGQDNIVTLGKL